MPCYTPLTGYHSKTKNHLDNYYVVFNPKYGWIDRPVTIPCGQCIGCRLRESRIWAMRCIHELKETKNKQSMFLTLTYSPEKLPPNGSLVLWHFQDFMKRYRKSLGDWKIRYFHCGEYGEKYKRPHYHAIIFGHEFDDKVLYSYDPETKCRTYTSDKLEKLWQNGFCTIGNVSYESCAYVARYVTKKINGEQADDHYWSLNEETGEIRKIIPEYITMSGKPGIGNLWYHKYKKDLYPSDFTILDGVKHPPGKYYDHLLKIDDEKLHKIIKNTRRAAGEKYKENNTPERLLVRETIQIKKMSQLKRNYELS